LLNAAAVDELRAFGRAKTLLVVEDDVLTRYAICDALRYAGYTVLEASSRPEAAAILAAVTVDLLFVDLNIPTEGEGVVVAEEARTYGPGVKVIFTSGRVSPSLRARLEEADCFIPKPYLISRVVRLVRRILAERTE
jgi:CheY-like chemotaxis protein